MAESSTPSKTPVSVTQTLAEIRLAHARLLEEHGAGTALLRRRESEIKDLERREAEIRQTVEHLESDIRALKEKVVRRENRAILAEREVGFSQALLVSITSQAHVLQIKRYHRRVSWRKKQLRVEQSLMRRRLGVCSSWKRFFKITNPKS